MTAQLPRTLEQCEAAIERSLQTFRDIGQALVEIRDGGLFRATHESFDSYCRQRWDFDRRRASALITAAEIAALVSEISDSPPPTRESHAAALAPLKDDPDALRAVWSKVRLEYGDDVTGKNVQDAVQEHLQSARPARAATFASVSDEAPTPIDREERAARWREQEEAEEEEEAAAAADEQAAEEEEEEDPQRRQQQDRWLVLGVDLLAHRGRSPDERAATILEQFGPARLVRSDLWHWLQDEDGEWLNPQPDRTSCFLPRFRRAAATLEAMIRKLEESGAPPPEEMARADDGPTVEAAATADAPAPDPIDAADDVVTGDDVVVPDVRTVDPNDVIDATPRTAEAWRKLRGYSLQTAAKRSRNPSILASSKARKGLSATIIGLLERGERDLTDDDRAALARAYDVKPDQIVPVHRLGDRVVRPDDPGLLAEVEGWWPRMSSAGRRADEGSESPPERQSRNSTPQSGEVLP